MSKISILGFGWLGLALGEKLLQGGYKVSGSVRNPDKIKGLKNAGIDPYLIEVLPNQINGHFSAFTSQADILVISLPPGLRKNPDYEFAKSIQLVLSQIPNLKTRVIFVSSTSVFKDDTDLSRYTEEETPNATSLVAKELIKAEQYISESVFKTTTIRPGGLIGADRHPIKYLAGKSDVKNPEAPVNLVAQDYLINLIVEMIETDKFFPVVHAISEPHTSRKSYYQEQALRSGLKPPIFDEESLSSGKYVESIYRWSF